MRSGSAACDLHLHTDRSDGTTPPRDLVGLAADARLAVMAVTDHDTFDAVEQAQDEGRRRGIRVVPGVELSLDHRGTFHMIALAVDPGNAEIRRVAETLREGRTGRNAAVFARLAELGAPVDPDAVARLAGGDVVARPHIAQALVAAGHVRGFQEAFDRYLGKGAPAYVDRPRVELADAVAAVRSAGGVSVVCHPFTLGYDTADTAGEAELRSFLRGLAAAGVDAMEVRCTPFGASEEAWWESVAADVGLLPSGGSDFHGSRKAGVRVGTGRGRLRVPVEWFEALEERASGRGYSPSSISSLTS